MCKARVKLNNCVKLGNIHVESLIYWVLSDSFWVKQASPYIFYLISKQLYWIQIHTISVNHMLVSIFTIYKQS